MRHLRDGLAGGVCALLPLLVVNVLGYLGVLFQEEALLAGTVALLGGLLAGGVVAGLLGGRVGARRAGGAAGALVAGGIAGALYLAALVALLAVAAQVGAEPAVLAEHPLRVGGALVCLATLLAAVALGVGALVGRGGRPTRTATRPRQERRQGSPVAARSTSHQPAHLPGRTPSRLTATGSTRQPAAPASGRRMRVGRPGAPPSSHDRR